MASLYGPASGGWCEEPLSPSGACLNSPEDPQLEGSAQARAPQTQICMHVYTCFLLLFQMCLVLFTSLSLYVNIFSSVVGAVWEGSVWRLAVGSMPLGMDFDVSRLTLFLFSLLPTYE